MPTPPWGGGAPRPRATPPLSAFDWIAIPCSAPRGKNLEIWGSTQADACFERGEFYPGIMRRAGCLCELGICRSPWRLPTAPVAAAHHQRALARGAADREPGAEGGLPYRRCREPPGPAPADDGGAARQGEAPSGPGDLSTAHVVPPYCTAPCCAVPHGKPHCAAPRRAAPRRAAPRRAVPCAVSCRAVLHYIRSRIRHSTARRYPIGELLGGGPASGCARGGAARAQARAGAAAAVGTPASRAPQPARQAGREAGKQGVREAGKLGNREAGKQGSREAGKLAGRQPARPGGQDSRVRQAAKAWQPTNQARVGCAK